MKKAISVLLTIVMILGVLPLNGIAEIDFKGLHLPEINLQDFSSLFSTEASAESSGTCGDDLTWTLDDEGTLTISGTGKMKNYLHNGSPWDSSRDSIKSVVISNSVTSIGDLAFYSCTGLTNITIPGSVTSIGDGAFSYCTGLTSVTIPDSVTSIGGWAFSGCTGLTDLKIGNGVLYIGTSAFCNCTGLTSITIPDSIKTIGGSAFNGCTGLTKITIPDSVTSIVGGAFSDCTGLTSIKIPNSVTSIGDSVFSGCTGLISIIIPNSVTSIGHSAFEKCTGLTEITISNSATSIGNSAFSGCTGLTSVTIPDSVTNIGNKAFSGCTGLASVTIGNNVTSIGNWAFCNCTGLTSITIPDSVTSIDDDAFSGCTGLTSITIGNGVTRIGNEAFSNCTSFTSITIPDSVTSIGYSAFSGCTDLTSVTIGNSVTSISSSAFSGCTGLTSVTIGNSVTSIDNSAFSGCTGLTSVTIGNSVTSIDNSAFSGCTGLTSITIGKHVKKIGSNAFYGCTGVDNINIPSSVREIGTNAFYNVNSITCDKKMLATEGAPWGALNHDCYREGSFVYYDTSKEVLIACDSDKQDIVVPDTVVQVEDYAFAACKNAKTITFKSKEIVFAPDSLKGCETIETIESANTDDGITYTCEIPKSTKLSASKVIEDITLKQDNGILFCNRKKSGNYTVPINIRYICRNAFANCKGCFVTIPDKVNLLYIGENAFLNGKNHIDWDKKGLFTVGSNIISAGRDVDNVMIPDTIKLIADCAFKNCIKLKSVTAEGNTLTAIGDYAFSGCLNLNKVTLPDYSVTSIGSRAFLGTKIYSAISDEPKYINNKYLVYVPYSLSGDFVVKNGTKCIADGAFAGCINITSVTLPEGITGIGEKTFYGCINLESVNIPDGVTVIDKSAFRGCSALKKISIPESVSRLDDQAFYGCYALKIIDVDENNKMYKDEDGVLFNKDGTVLIQYPAGKEIEKYKIEEEVKLINSFAFRMCKNVNVVLIPDNVELGRKNPFELCTAVYARYGEGDSCNDYTLYDYTLYRDETKKEIVSVSNRFGEENAEGIANTVYTIAPEVESIAANAFAGNEKITGIIFNDNLERIEDEAFKGCTGIKKVEFPESLVSVGDSAFEDCTSLSEITFAVTNGAINDVITSIGEKAFCNCAENKTENSGILKNKKIQIGDYAFHNHKYKDKITPSDCVDAGMRERTCTECGHIEIEIIQPTGHDFGEYVSIVAGTKTATCKNCRMTDTVSEGTQIDPAEPTPTEPTPTEPTPAEPTPAEAEPAHEHSYKGEVTTKPTCTEDGIMTYTCECGETYTQAIPKTGHKPGEWTVVTPATTEAAGKEVRKCTVCGEVLAEREIAKLEPDESKIKVSAPSGTITNVRYNQPAKIIASATGLPKNYKLAIYEGGSQKKSATANDAGEAAVEFETGAVTSDRTFTVKVLDASGKEVEGKSKTLTIDVNDGFFQKIISFFLKLFGALKLVEIKP